MSSLSATIASLQNLIEKKSPCSSDCIYSIFLYHRVFRKLSLQTCNFFNGRSVIFLFVSDSFYLLSGSFSFFALHTMWVIDVVQKAVAEGEGSSTPKCVWDWESPRRSVQAPIVGRSQRVATTQKSLHWFSEESETVYYVDS